MSLRTRATAEKKRHQCSLPALLFACAIDAPPRVVIDLVSSDDEDTPAPPPPVPPSSSRIVIHIDDSDDEEEPPAPPPSPRPPPPAASASGPGPPSHYEFEEIALPASAKHVALRVARTTITDGNGNRLEEPGLFYDGTEPLPPNSFIGVYSYDRVAPAGDAALAVLSKLQLSRLGKYALFLTNDSTLLVDVPPNYTRHPLTASNEPESGGKSNCTMEGAKVQTTTAVEGEFREFYVIALYSCESSIMPHEELLWNYGKDYAPIRKEVGYKAGPSCSPSAALRPPLREVAQRLVDAGLEGAIVEMEESSSSDADSDDDPDYRPPKKRAQSQPRPARKR